MNSKKNNYMTNNKDEVSLNGWVGKIKKMGGLIFFDLLSGSKNIQIVVNEKEKIKDTLKVIKSGDLVNVKGLLKKKEGNNHNEEIKSEIVLGTLTLINKTTQLPFEIKNEIELKEDNRFRYRYLDLRREKIKNIVLIKHEFLHYIRNFFYVRKFIEIETPILSQSSPEGAKTFIVPSNLEGRAYTLPQSPQIFKQILMVAGFEKYYQIAKTFRNEDSRSNRQPEFLQLDIEMSFANQEYLFSIIEEMITEFLTKFLKIKNENIEFEKISFENCMNFYGTDKPDLRNSLKIIKFNKNCFSEESEFIEKGIYFERSLNFDKKKLQEIIEEYEIDEFVVFNKKKDEVKIILKKFNKKENQNRLKDFKNGFYIILKSKINNLNEVLGKIRNLFSSFFINNKPENKKCYKFVWITDWPLFEYNQQESRINSFRHPFTLPKKEHISNLKFDNESLLKIKAEAYDLVCNGEEIASGSLRIYKRELQERIFEILGFKKEKMEKHFGYFLKALDFAAPPCGGIGLGIERMIAIFLGLKSIKETIAFPKNTDGSCSLTGAPNYL